MRNWDQLLENYMRHCQARGLSETTIAGRHRELERWGVWLKRCRPKPQIEKLDPSFVIDYVKSRTAFHSKSSVCGVMSHIRCMGEYLVNVGVWTQNPLRWIRSPKIDPRRQIPKRIERDHLLKLLRASATFGGAYGNSLSTTTLLLLYGTGIRRGELERLNLEDWDSTQGTLRIDSKKVNLQRTIPVPGPVAACIESYLPQRLNRLIRFGKTNEKALFISPRGERLSGERVSLLVHRLAKRAEIPLVTIHQFRHTCASDLLEEGLRLHEVQKVLGHAYIVTTTRYTQVTDPARKQAVALHPINQILSQSSAQFGAINEAN